MAVARNGVIVLLAALFAVAAGAASAAGLPVRGDGTVSALVPYGNQPGRTLTVEVEYRFRVGPLLGDIVQSGNVKWALAGGQVTLPRPGSEGDLFDTLDVADIPLDVLRQIALYGLTLAVYGENSSSGETGSFLIDMGVPSSDPEKWSFNAPEAPGWDAVLFRSMNRFDKNRFRSVKPVSEYEALTAERARAILAEGFILTFDGDMPRVDVVEAKLDLSPVINWWTEAGLARARYEANLQAADAGIEAITELLGGAGPVIEKRDAAKALAAKGDYAAAAHAAEQAARPFRKELPKELGIAQLTKTDSGEEITVSEAYERTRRTIVATLDEAEDNLKNIAPLQAKAPQWQEAKRRELESRPELQMGEFRDCDVCPEMVMVPAGSFQMGSPRHEEGRTDNEGPVHSVTIPRDFAVGKYEVTKAEYAAFVSATGYSGVSGCHTYEGGKWEYRSGRSWRDPGFGQSDRDPAVCLSWDDARAYTEWLTRQAGKAYRLLSEAEWEYAARAGTTTAIFWGSDSASACGYANVNDSTSQSVYGSIWGAHACDDGVAQTAAAGSYQANAFGLYDMLGNIWEWTADCWNDSYAGAPSDGSAWTRGDCERRAIRGGAWYDGPGDVRSANRYGYETGNRNYGLGFRVARTD